MFAFFRHGIWLILFPFLFIVFTTELLFAYHWVYDPASRACVTYMPLRQQQQQQAPTAAAAAAAGAAAKGEEKGASPPVQEGDGEDEEGGGNGGGDCGGEEDGAGPVDKEDEAAAAVRAELIVIDDSSSDSLRLAARGQGGEQKGGGGGGGKAVPVLERPPREELGLEALDLPVVGPELDLEAVLGCVDWMGACVGRGQVVYTIIISIDNKTSYSYVRCHATGTRSTSSSCGAWPRRGCTRRRSSPWCCPPFLPHKTRRTPPRRPPSPHPARPQEAVAAGGCPLSFSNNMPSGLALGLARPPPRPPPVALHPSSPPATAAAAALPAAGGAAVAPSRRPPGVCTTSRRGSGPRQR